LTVYTQFINGAKGPLQPDGPEALHVVFVDNRRSEVLASNCREILRCIPLWGVPERVPVYRQASGHAYRAVYPGPWARCSVPCWRAHASPSLPTCQGFKPLRRLQRGLPRRHPHPGLLLRLRDRGKREGARAATAGTPPMGAWALLCRQPAAGRPH
jgi:L-lactate dehydrogenase complex protein LldF